MNSWYDLVDLSIEIYIKQKMDNELHQDMEDLIFFSSYTISLEVFKEATKKLKKSLVEEQGELNVSEKEEIKQFLRQYHLNQRLSKKKERYIAKELIKAHIKINEAVMEHFHALHKNAHSVDYLHDKKDKIYKLLEDESMDKI